MSDKAFLSNYLLIKGNFLFTFYFSCVAMGRGVSCCCGSALTEVRGSAEEKDFLPTQLTYTGVSIILVLELQTFLYLRARLHSKLRMGSKEECTPVQMSVKKT